MHLSHRRILYSLLSAAVLVAAWLLRRQLILFLGWIGDRQAVTDSIQQFGAWGPAVLFLLMILQTFLAIIPGHALTLAGGYVFGFPISLLIVFSSTVLGSQIAFWIARRLGRPAVYRLASSNTILRWEELASRQGILFFFLTFVLPFFPSDLMCYVAGLGTISSFRFLIANLLGRIVVSTPMTLIGSRSLQMPAAFWVAASLFWTLLFGGWYLLTRRRGLFRSAPKTQITEKRAP